MRHPPSHPPDPNAPKPSLSVVIPCYNEARTVKDIVGRVLAEAIVDEVVIVDDGSTDGTRAILAQIETEADSRVQILYHEENRGKGAALVTGFQRTTGEVIIIQDADFEYDPREYSRLLTPIQEGVATVVYGSRFLGGTRKAMNFWNMVANKGLTLITNILFNAILSDMETCYKCFRREVVMGMTINARGFDFEPEFTAKVLRQGIRIVEVPISYYGREYDEGKKIKWTDAPIAAWTLLRYRFFE
ncbi:MAG: glycosyltransferase family 2 protein [Chloroflexi bacterium]|nr:glycosyltransferase family 2 protein [Chloroflexota bacterium]MCY3581269.1 glycosyltransferase family 2 protein [Chloroflexota bacterium]MCY3716013.1 glycosyltransferase family 2 protein [Chloroflexota bacterium]MDE2651187.1 glycosyltransferase family 2 protein [Chloroflexota bacterium]MYC54588.1 glycosyltransferase family 2 protein [Chloroflexota bacterium]